MRWEESAESRKIKTLLITFCVLLIFIDFAQLQLDEVTLFGVSFSGAQADGVLLFAAWSISILLGYWLLMFLRDVMILYHLLYTVQSIRRRFMSRRSSGPSWTTEVQFEELGYAENIDKFVEERASPYDHRLSSHRLVLFLKFFALLFQVGGPIILYVIAIIVTFPAWIYQAPADLTYRRCTKIIFGI